MGSAAPTYDADGDLASDGTYSYCYDAERRLTGILSAGTCASPATVVASYAYDAQGRRKSKTMGSSTTIYVTDAADREVLEYAGSSGAVSAWYAYAAGPNAVLNRMNVAGSSRQTLIPDIQGSIVGSLDANTGTLTRTGYQPFGANPSLSGGSFQYTAARFDPESGFYYMRTRMYRTDWGRFTQPDLIGYAGGANLYAYTDNDPLNLTDPSGNCPWCVGAVIGAGANVLALYLSDGNKATWQQYVATGAIGAIAGATFNVEAVAANIGGAIARTGASNVLSAAGADIIGGAVNGGASNVANQLISPASNGVSVGEAVRATLFGGAGAGLTGTISASEAAGSSALPNTVKQLVGQVADSSVDTINTELASPNGLPPGVFSSTPK